MIEGRVLQFVREQGLTSPGETVVVAVSGGPDSLCLLHVLLELRGELGIALHVAHLDHCLRGAASAADAEFVSGLASSLGLPVTVGRRDVASYQKSRHLSVEEAAREARYQFLWEVAQRAGSTTVAVGHTAADQAETILMHLIRGAGATGLRGMSPLTILTGQDGHPLRVIRPLLELSRDDVEAYCRARGLEPRRDATNLSLSPFRNRLRQELMPLLRTYNPNIEAALLRTGRGMSDNLAFLEKETTSQWSRVVEEGEGYLVFHASPLLALPPALQRGLMRKALHRLLGSLKDVEARHAEAMLAALKLPPGSKLCLPGGLVFTVEYGRYLLSLDPATLCPFPPLGEERMLEVPGETLIGGWRIKAELASPQDIQDASDKALFQGRGLKAALRWQGSGEELKVRGRRPGDRFQPLGMAGTKKFQDFMVDAKVPRAWRDRVPLVCSPRGILWVVGWRLSEMARPGNAAGEVLLLEFELAGQG